LEETLQHAEGLYYQIKNFKNLPENLREIFGLHEVNQIKSNLIQDSSDTIAEKNNVMRSSLSNSLISSNVANEENVSNCLAKENIEDTVELNSIK
jgi:hypothetical protein